MQTKNVLDFQCCLLQSVFFILRAAILISIFVNHQLFNAEHVIGSFDNGSEVAQKLLAKSRLQAGVISVVMMKKIINILTKYCVDTAQGEIKLM